MSFIATLIVYLIVLGLLWWLVKLLPLPNPIGQIIDVLFIILAILAVLAAFGVMPSFPRIKF
jgi:heme A synthase